MEPQLAEVHKTNSVLMDEAVSMAPDDSAITTLMASLGLTDAGPEVRALQAKLASPAVAAPLQGKRAAAIANAGLMWSDSLLFNFSRLDAARIL